MDLDRDLQQQRETLSAINTSAHQHTRTCSTDRRAAQHSEHASDEAHAAHLGAAGCWGAWPAQDHLQVLRARHPAYLPLRTLTHGTRAAQGRTSRCRWCSRQRPTHPARTTITCGLPCTLSCSVHAGSMTVHGVPWMCALLACWHAWHADGQATTNTCDGLTPPGPTTKSEAT